MITTDRLELTPLVKRDAKQLQALFRDPELIFHPLPVPRPFEEDGMAEAWIENLNADQKIFAIRRPGRTQLIGVAGLMLKANPGVAEYAILIAVPYWGKGYTKETTKALLDYGFGELGLTRIYATSFTRNLNTRRELEKLGMEYEGCLKQHVQYWGQWEDLHVHGIVRQQYHLEN